MHTKLPLAIDSPGQSEMLESLFFDGSSTISLNPFRQFGGIGKISL